MKKIIASVLFICMLIVPILSGCQNENPEGEKPTKLLIEEKKPESGTPDDYSPLENLSFTAYKFNRTPTWESHYNGEVTAVVAFISTKQQVKNRRIYDNGVLFNEAISVSSLKKVAEQKYYNGDAFLVRQPKSIDKNNISATWNEDIKKLSEEDYYKEYGLKPNELFKYVMNAATITSAEKLDGYKYKFVLSTECAEYLKNEVRTMAGASSNPEFLEMECTIEIDKNWNIIRTTTKERYKLPIFGGITCTSTSTEEFTLNKSVTIPDRELFNSYTSEADSVSAD